MKQKRGKILIGIEVVVTVWAMLTACGGGGGASIPKVWGEAKLIETYNAGDASYPQIAMDSSGNAMAVWEQKDGSGRINIWANHYTADIGWGIAAPIETDDTGDALQPQIAMDRSGRAMAVWQQSDGNRINIWARRYTPDNGWGIGEQIETYNAGDAEHPQVAMDNNGSAFAVWHAGNNTWANRYTSGSGWGTAEQIETSNDSYLQKIAMDDRGNAIATWVQWDSGIGSNIWANRYTPDNGWGTAELIETNNAGGADPKIAMDSSGNSIVVWEQVKGSGIIYYAWANHYTVGSGWGVAKQIYDNDIDGDLQIAMNDSGHAIVIGKNKGIWINHYTQENGWGTAKLIEPDTDGHIWHSGITMNNSGNAIAIWNQESNSKYYHIRAKLYHPNSGWSTTELIETDEAGNALHPQITMNNNGSAIAIWDQNNSNRTNIWANHFE